jgi:hypothetical protein
MNPATDRGSKNLPVLVRVALVVAGLALGAFIAVGYIVAADLNQAYFGSRGVSVAAIDMAAAILALYCVLAGARGRWRIL